ncbi:WXG100 family type VII secretion target [uncultured Mycobacterium sp.]|uniref:WXG100 family type VII secretion target n=1 Tax=uncultured Mycobacterium sp. TaxID=171292 RepID=UPI0035C9811E
MALVGHPQLVAFADQMDELSQRVQDVLQQYLNHSMELHSGGGLTGAAGTANIQTTQDVHDAQARIQARFQQLNDLVRQNAHGYANTDHNNQQTIAAVPGALRFQ